MARAGCPLQHTVSELTDAAHPARAIAHHQREWFAERFLEGTKAAGVKDPKATARALIVLFDGAVAGSEVDGPQRASDARWIAKKLLTGCTPSSDDERSLQRHTILQSDRPRASAVVRCPT